MNLHHRQPPNEFKLLNIVENLDTSPALTLDLGPLRSIANEVNRLTLSEIAYRDRGGLSSPLSFTSISREGTTAIRPQRFNGLNAQSIGTAISGMSFATNEGNQERQRNTVIERNLFNPASGSSYQNSLAREFNQSFTGELVPMIEEVTRPIGLPNAPVVIPLGPPPALPSRPMRVNILGEHTHAKVPSPVAPSEGTSCNTSQPGENSSYEGQCSKSSDNRSWTVGDEAAWSMGRRDNPQMGNRGYVVNTDPYAQYKADPFEFCIPVEDNDRAILYELEKLQGLKIGDISNMRQVNQNEPATLLGEMEPLKLGWGNPNIENETAETLAAHGAELETNEKYQYQTHDYQAEERLLRMKIEPKNEEIQESTDESIQPKKSSSNFFSKLPQILKIVRTKLRNAETPALPTVAV